MKLKFRYLLYLVIITLTIAGCSNVQPAMSGAPDSETITIWVWDETFNVRASKMAAEAYKESHPNVKINVQIREREEILADTKNLLSTKVYKDLPDIIMLEDYDIQEMLTLYEDEFVDLTDKINADKFVDYKLRLCSKNGRVYGIPFDSGTTALFYRLDILEQAGYDETDMQNLTWDRFIEIGKDVYKKTGISMLTLDPTDFPLVRIIMQSCATWYCADDGVTVTVKDNAALYEALKILKTLLESNIGKSVNGWNEFISAFQNNQVASVISGAWVISSIKAAPEQSGNWRIAPIPVVASIPNSMASSNIGGSAWYILKHGNAADIATDFMVSTFSDNNEFWSQLIDAIDIVPCVKHPEVFSNFENEDPFFGNQQVTKILTTFANQVPAINYGNNTYEIENILEDAFQTALVNYDLIRCLDAVQTKAQAISQK